MVESTHPANQESDFNTPKHSQINEALAWTISNTAGAMSDATAHEISHTLEKPGKIKGFENERFLLEENGYEITNTDPNATEYVYEPLDMKTDVKIDHEKQTVTDLRPMANAA